MSQLLINRSPDLKRLRDEGYTVSIQNGLLVIEDVPYVNSQKDVSTGILISKLALSGETAVYDQDHVAHFIGDFPCDSNGCLLKQIMHNQGEEHLGGSIISKMSFSSKPSSGYSDYHHKMITYINILTSHAASLDPKITPKKYRVVKDETDETIFNYFDTNSSRASIADISSKLKSYKIGIIGLGGTGAYILDFIAKTPVQEIHLFDGDILLSHNAFRTPGAASIDDLNAAPLKVEYLDEVYSRMHKGIYTYPTYLDDLNLNLVNNLDYVFVAIDSGNAKAKIFHHLESLCIPYIDVGMGINIANNMLLGTLRTTAIDSFSKPTAKQHIDFGDDNDGIYQSNIQISELNALNAAMAVIGWKKHAGFYHTTLPVFETCFTLDTFNIIRKSDAA